MAMQAKQPAEGFYFWKVAHEKEIHSREHDYKC